MANIQGLFRIGRDVELRYTQDGTAVAGLSLAFNYGRKGEDGKKPTQWVDASFWGQRAESLAPYLLKGTLIFAVLDDPHIETFQRQDGTQGHKLAGRISAIEFASKPESTGQAQQQRSAPPQRQSAPAQTQQRQPAASLADMDDDIPF